MKYTGKNAIKSVQFKHKGKEFNVKADKTLSGVYSAEKGGSFDDYTYIPKRDIISTLTKDGKVSDRLNGLWVLTSELSTPVSKKKPVVKAKKVVAKKEPTKVVRKTTVKSDDFDISVGPSAKFPDAKGLLKKAIEFSENAVNFNKKRLGKNIVYDQLDSLRLVFNETEKDFADFAYLFLWVNHNISAIGNKMLLDKVKPDILKEVINLYQKTPTDLVKVKQVKRGDFLNNPTMLKISDKFTGKDNLRPVMTFIKIDDGYAVSTDANLLLGIYDKSLKGKDELVCENKYCFGDTVEHRYPNWKAVIPESVLNIKIDPIKILSEIKKLTKYNLLNNITHAFSLQTNDDKKAFYNAKFLSKIIESITQLNGEDLYIKDLQPKRAMIIAEKDFNSVNSNKDFALTMPLMSSDYFLNPTYNIETNEISFSVKEENFEKGGSIGFKGLSKKAAKNYVGKKVPKKYQSEYGKTYSPKEAQEVGNKIAASIYQKQKK